MVPTRLTAQRLRLAVLQRVCPGYRVALFSALAAAEDAEVRLFIGEDLPHSKVMSGPNLGAIPVTRLRTRFLKLGRRTMPWHVRLVDELRAFQPDVILCEGESHFLGYLQAMYYRARFGRHVALMHWCFITLPGEPNPRRDIAGMIKGYLRKYFDAFVVYSSFSRDRLLELGEPGHKIFVATNVGDVGRFLALADGLSDTKMASRRALGLAERFTVLYAGTLDENKRPDVMLDLAGTCDPERYTFVVVGAGPLLEGLRERVARERLANVYLPGRVSDEMVQYYRAADVLLIPGRGGIVMSEALASGLPVIVHQADGTEYDLVQSGVTGYRVASSDVRAFAAALESLRSCPDLVASMSANGRQLVRSRFNVHSMVQHILEASRFARNTRVRETSKG